ncbi:MAG: hypothetical protein AAF206_03455 [Bacteroidota bacterium]
MNFRLIILIGMLGLPLLLNGQNRSVYLRNNSSVQFNQTSAIVTSAIGFRGIAPAIVFHQGKYRHQIEISQFGLNTFRIDTTDGGIPDFFVAGETFAINLGMRYQGDYLFTGDGDVFSPFVGLSVNNLSTFQTFRPIRATDFGNRFSNFEARMELVFGLLAPISERIRFNIEPHLNLFTFRRFTTRVDDPNIPPGQRDFTNSFFESFNFDQVAIYFGFEMKI